MPLELIGSVTAGVDLAGSIKRTVIDNGNTLSSPLVFNPAAERELRNKGVLKPRLTGDGTFLRLPLSNGGGKSEEIVAISASRTSDYFHVAVEHLAPIPRIFSFDASGGAASLSHSATINMADPNSNCSIVDIDCRARYDCKILSITDNVAKISNGDFFSGNETAHTPAPNSDRPMPRKVFSDASGREVIVAQDGVLFRNTSTGNTAFTSRTIRESYRGSDNMSRDGVCHLVFGTKVHKIDVVGNTASEHLTLPYNHEKWVMGDVSSAGPRSIIGMSYFNAGSMLVSMSNDGGTTWTHESVNFTSATFNDDFAETIPNDEIMYLWDLAIKADGTLGAISLASTNNSGKIYFIPIVMEQQPVVGVPTFMGSISAGLPLQTLPDSLIFTQGGVLVLGFAYSGNTSTAGVPYLVSTDTSSGWIDWVIPAVGPTHILNK